MSQLSLYKQNVELYLSIPPSHSREPLAAVQEHMDSLILSKLPQVKGIVLAYENVNFLEKAAKIMYDSPFSFVWVSVDVLLFSPEKDDRLGMYLRLVIKGLTIQFSLPFCLYDI